MKLKLGELCAGYGGLGMAVEDVFNADAVWFSEFDEAPSKILAHHWPHVPNYGDMTKIDWANIEPVDIISGGTPCQDLSGAGKRAGMTEGTRSNLWVQMREAIAIQQPTYVVWENVRGAYSAKADSSLEQCPGCMGSTGDAGTVLRALGRVLGDLSDLGYDCQWRGLRAADVGACHGRFRVFVLAVRRPGILATEDSHDRRGAKSDHGHQRRGEASRWASAVPDPSDSRPGPTKDTDLPTGSERRQPTPGQTEGGRERPDSRGRSGAPATAGNGYVSTSTPWWAEGDPAPDSVRSGSRRWAAEPGSPRCHYAVIGSGTRGSWARAAAANTNRGHDPGRQQDQERIQVRGTAPEWISRGGRRRETTPDTAGSERRGAESDYLGTPRESAAEPGKRPGGDPINWGPYAPAIRRWEAVRGAAPSPTELTAKGNHRLSARFAEWMMGLPAGWVTDPAIGLTRNEQLKACGNGVVPQQAAAALQDMLQAFEVQLEHVA